MIEAIRCDGELGVGIEHDEVGVVAAGDAALAGVASGQLGGPFGHPARDVSQVEASLLRFGPDYRQSKREAGDASPRISKISFSRLLHELRTRGVVGRDYFDDAVLHALPEALTIWMAADRRGAFILRGPVGYLFGLKVQIVRAGFDSNRKPCGACGLQHLKSQAGCEVDDVQAETIVAAQQQHQLDCGYLGLGWSRAE